MESWFLRTELDVFAMLFIIYTKQVGLESWWKYSDWRRINPWLFSPTIHTFASGFNMEPNVSLGLCSHDRAVEMCMHETPNIIPNSWKHVGDTSIDWLLSCAMVKLWPWCLTACRPGPHVNQLAVKWCLKLEINSDFNLF